MRSRKIEPRGETKLPGRRRALQKEKKRQSVEGPSTEKSKPGGIQPRQIRVGTKDWQKKKAKPK